MEFVEQTTIQENVFALAASVKADAMRRSNSIFSRVLESQLIPAHDESLARVDFANKLRQAHFWLSVYRSNTSDIYMYFDYLKHYYANRYPGNFDFILTDIFEGESIFIDVSKYLLGDYWGELFIKEANESLEVSSLIDIKKGLIQYYLNNDLTFRNFIDLIVSNELISAFMKYSEAKFYYENLLSCVGNENEEIAYLSTLCFLTEEYFENSSFAWNLPKPLDELETHWHFFLTFNEVFGRMCLNAADKFKLNTKSCIRSNKIEDANKLENPLLLILVYSYGLTIYDELVKLKPSSRILSEYLVEYPISTTDFNVIDKFKDIKDLYGYRGEVHPPPELIAYNLLIKVIEELSYFYNGDLPALHNLSESLYKPCEMLLFPKTVGAVYYHWLKLLKIDPRDTNWLVKIDSATDKLNNYYLPAICHRLNQYFLQINENKWSHLKRKAEVRRKFSYFQYELNTSGYVPVKDPIIRPKGILRTIQKAQASRRIDNKLHKRTIPDKDFIASLRGGELDYLDTAAILKRKYILDLYTASCIININSFNLTDSKGNPASWILEMLDFLDKKQINDFVVDVVSFDTDRLKDIFPFIQTLFVIRNIATGEKVFLEFRFIQSEHIPMEDRTQREREDPLGIFLAHGLIVRSLVQKSAQVDRQNANLDIINLSINEGYNGRVYYYKSESKELPILLQVLTTGTFEEDLDRTPSEETYMSHIIHLMLDLKPPREVLLKPIKGRFVNIELQRIIDGASAYKYGREERARKAVVSALPAKYATPEKVPLNQVVMLRDMFALSDFFAVGNHITHQGRAILLDYLLKNSSRNIIKLYIALLHGCGKLTDADMVALAERDVFERSVAPGLHDYWKKIPLHESPLIHWAKGGSIDDLMHHLRLEWIIPRFKNLN